MHACSRTIAALAVAAAVTAIACGTGSGSANDGAGGESVTLVLGAYTTPREAYGKAILPAFREHWKARERDAALAAIGDAWVDEVQIMGDAAHVRAKVDAYEQGGARPIVFALPWGEDRAATVRETIEALA